MKISVVTVVLNSRATLAHALESVLAQIDVNHELIAIDGASEDGTLDVLHQYSHQLSNLVSEQDEGAYDAMNKGVRLATGDVVGFLHADDVLADNRVLARIAQALSDPSFDAVYGDLQYVSRNDPNRVFRHWRAGEYSRERLRWGWMPPHPTFYVRRSCYERLGEFDTSLKIAADYDCMLRFLEAGIRVKYIPEVLVRMRVGGVSNRSLGNIIRKSQEDLRALRKNGVGGFFSLACKNLRKVKQFVDR